VLILDKMHNAHVLAFVIEENVIVVKLYRPTATGYIR